MEDELEARIIEVYTYYHFPLNQWEKAPIREFTK